VTVALVWKEFREQWAVWLTLTVAAVVGAAGLYSLMSPGRFRIETAIGILWFAAWGYGLICGTMLTAGEVEDDTQTFLDSLPVSRRRLWAIKAATGLAFLVVQLVALAAVAYALVHGYAYPSGRLIGDGLFLLVAGGVGYAWGLFCGSFASNVLAALGWTVLLQALSWLALYPVVMIPASIMFAPRNPQTVMPAIWLSVAALAGLAVAVRSRAVYARNDTLRDWAAAPPRKAPVQRGWAVMFWLAWRQVRGFALAMAGFALFATAVIVFFRLAAWPLVTIFIGVLCGVTTFADEQQSGTYRFAGDQRFPLARIWLVKVLVRFGAGAAATAIIVLGIGIVLAVRLGFIAPILTVFRFQSEFETWELDFRFGVTSGFAAQPYVFRSLWLVYGFAVGLPCGLLFRKPLPAGVIACFLAYPLGLVWFPSLLITAGLHAWQVFGVPAVLVLATLAFMRPWVTDRMVSARVAIATSLAATLAFAWLCGAIWYRAVEIPKAPDAIDPVAFAATLPKIEDNGSGRTTLSALRQLAELEASFVRDEQGEAQRVRAGGTARHESRLKFFDSVGQAGIAGERGWQAADPHLGEFLDLICSTKSPWANGLAEAADMPTGVVIDPRVTTVSSASVELEAAGRAGVFLSARGLQKQALGDPVAFVNALHSELALAKNLRYHTTHLAVERGQTIETFSARAVEHWLAHLDGRPDLLRRALDLELSHWQSPPVDWEDIRDCEVVVAFNALSDARNLPLARTDSNLLTPSQSSDSDLVRFSMQVPWERERLHRLVDATASKEHSLNLLAGSLTTPFIQNAVTGIYRTRYDTKKWPSRNDMATFDAALLQLALRLYQAEKGKPAEQLELLVPDYLPSIPNDPFDGNPFRYRLSRGETLNWPPADVGDGGMHKSPPTRRVAAGQGILWCVGEDGVDQGGHTQVSPHATGIVPGEDLIFLVPLPPGRAK
jgi:ABC-type transport system involved in multi-copper enzyme maturation permease subunit